MFHVRRNVTPGPHSHIALSRLEPAEHHPVELVFQGVTLQRCRRL